MVVKEWINHSVQNTNVLSAYGAQSACLGIFLYREWIWNCLTLRNITFNVMFSLLEALFSQIKQNSTKAWWWVDTRVSDCPSKGICHSDLDCSELLCYYSAVRLDNQLISSRNRQLWVFWKLSNLLNFPFTVILHSHTQNPYDSSPRKHDILGCLSIIPRREPEAHSVIYIQQLVTEHEHPLMLPH